MKKFMEIAKQFYKDEKAAEVTELGIVLALIVAGAVAFIAVIGPHVQDAYESTGDALDAAALP